MNDNDRWEVFVLEYANSHEPWVGLVSGMYDAGMVDLPFSFVLARRGEQNVLVDCGFMRQGNEAEFPLKFGVSRWISPLRMLAELGVTPEAVSDIVVTHAHFDHLGSIGEFPKARIHIQKRELLSCYEALALPKRFAHLSKIVDPANIRMALEASIEHRVNLVDGDRDNLLPGIHVRLGPGHTPGHQFVIVETAVGRRVISGDCLYSNTATDRPCGRWRLCAAQQCDGLRLGPVAHARPGQRGDRRRSCEPDRDARCRPLGRSAAGRRGRGIQDRPSGLTVLEGVGKKLLSNAD